MANVGPSYFFFFGFGPCVKCPTTCERDVATASLGSTIERRRPNAEQHRPVLLRLLIQLGRFGRASHRPVNSCLLSYLLIQTHVPTHDGLHRLKYLLHEREGRR
ncbi:MAG: hypothetical protein FE78DRAFT_464500 [Acidomyces sp. 'richmondensis']|nr:MAG: hypothetical protein FE78DRAFT_464500 [Acidomyces sp. 'richmondensis']